MPELWFYGIVIRMFYNDHNPPHFHVEYQDYEAIIEVDSGLIKGELPRRAIKLVYEWLDLHHEELLKNWDLAQNREPLNPIDPLK